jgi:hypothetical protein
MSKQEATLVVVGVLTAFLCVTFLVFYGRLAAFPFLVTEITLFFISLETEYGKKKVR